MTLESSFVDARNSLLPTWFRVDEKARSASETLAKGIVAGNSVP